MDRPPRCHARSTLDQTAGVPLRRRVIACAPASCRTRRECPRAFLGQAQPRLPASGGRDANPRSVEPWRQLWYASNLREWCLTQVFMNQLLVR